jgi:Cu(I)/Ag(I) efflux system membrane protein CusA/SilA
MRFPEVDRVFGKVGRAATDPAGLEMFETTIRFKPRSDGSSASAEVDMLRCILTAGMWHDWV